MNKVVTFLLQQGKKINEDWLTRWFHRFLLANLIFVSGSIFAVLWDQYVIFMMNGESPLDLFTPKVILGFAFLMSIYLLGMFVEIRFFQKQTTQFLGRWFLQSSGLMLIAQSLVMFGYAVGTRDNTPNPHVGLEVLMSSVFIAIGVALVIWSTRKELDITKVQ